MVKMNKDSIFMDYLGKSPTVRILNFLILGKDFDYSMTKIAEGSNVGGHHSQELGRNWKRKKLLCIQEK